MFLRLNLRRGNSTIFFGAPEWSTDNGPLKRQDVARLLAGCSVCFLIHGYNVRNADGAYSVIYKRLLERGWYDHVVGVWWPGSDIALAFWLASLRAEKAGRILAEELAGIPALIDLEAHSLGCKVALDALDSGLLVRNAVLAAAAVDNESVLTGEKYGNAVRRADSVVVCYSESDLVLRSAYRLAKLDNALGFTGPRPLGDRVPPSVVAYDLNDDVGSHGAYKTSDAFYRIWERYAGVGGGVA